MSETRVAPIGPLNGRPEICVDADAALMASTSYWWSGVQRKDRDDDLDLVAQTLFEGGTQRAVDQPAGEDGVGGGAALATEERAGDLPGGIHALFDIDRQREEVEVVLRVLAGRGGRQQHRVFIEIGDNCASGLFGQPAGLEPNRSGAVGAVVDGGFGKLNFWTLHWVLLFSQASRASSLCTYFWDGPWIGLFYWMGAAFGCASGRRCS